MQEQLELSSQEIGRRLRIARETANVRQDEAAQAIGVSRPTIVAVEQGVRRARVEEIQRLAQYYGTTVNALLRRAAIYTDLVPRFRKLPDGEDIQVLEATRALNELVRAEVELENLLGVVRKRSYPPERSVGEGDVMLLAEQHAKELREFIGVTCGPIPNLASLVESKIGVRLYIKRLSSRSRVSGLFAFEESVGACVLLNANHRPSRRIQTLAHELGHFIGSRHSPEVLDVDAHSSSRIERYANAFGRALLTPAEDFRESFRKLKAITGKITRRLVVLLAHEYRISRQAAVLRLEEIKEAKSGTWAWFEANGGITDEQAKEVLGSSYADDLTDENWVDPLVSHKMSLMAHAAWHRNLLSEGQLADLLHVDRVTLRGLIDRIELDQGITDARGLK